MAAIIRVFGGKWWWLQPVLLIGQACSPIRLLNGGALNHLIEAVKGLMQFLAVIPRGVFDFAYRRVFLKNLSHFR